jgi:hypothetical protein
MIVTGTLKSRIAHPEGAAGIAGLLKVVSQLRGASMYSNLHLSKCNPMIDLEGFTTLLPSQFGLLTADASLCVGLSSFGFSGTNSHAVLGAPQAHMSAHTIIQLQSTVQYQQAVFMWWDFSGNAAKSTALPGLTTGNLERDSQMTWGHSQEIVPSGIVALEYYAPNLCCSVADVEQLHNCPGRYTVGRGQQHIGFCSDDEDTVSMAMTVFERLVCSCEMPLTQIGRLEVGTESQVDRAKSVKSFLMTFFEAEGLHNVEGVDTYNVSSNYCARYHLLLYSSTH